MTTLGCKLCSAVLLVSSLWWGTAFASGAKVHLDDAHVDLSDTRSLQRGAKVFVNYCLSCHGAKYMRYNRAAQDLNIPEALMEENLMFTADKIGNTMNVNMKSKHAEAWFGTEAPDLSVIARSRSPDWIYTYLRYFYVDESRPFGVDNVLFPKVAMPHVLWELQGMQKAVFKTEKDEHSGILHTTFSHFEPVDEGMTALELKERTRRYDRTVRDLVNFLTYMGEPVHMERKSLGVKVLFFLLIFLVFAYLLKKEYWRDVH